MSVKEKTVVSLTTEQRVELERFASTGKHSAAAITRARILLKTDTGPCGPAWEDARIAEAVDCATETVARCRKQFAKGGLSVVLSRKRPACRRYRKFDGGQEKRQSWPQWVGFFQSHEIPRKSTPVAHPSTDCTQEISRKQVAVLGQECGLRGVGSPRRAAS